MSRSITFLENVLPHNHSYVNCCIPSSRHIKNSHFFRHNKPHQQILPRAATGIAKSLFKAILIVLQLVLQNIN